MSVQFGRGDCGRLGPSDAESVEIDPIQNTYPSRQPGNSQKTVAADTPKIGTQYTLDFCIGGKPAIKLTDRCVPEPV